MSVIKYTHKKKFVSDVNVTHYCHTDKIKVSEKEPGPVQLSWLGITPQSTGVAGRALLRARALQVQSPKGVHMRGNQPSFSPSFSLPSPLSKQK